ncbi:hypothetical protein DBV10_12240 [Acidovorax sp. FJL06]|nr:hypothetical protein DBV10_12240 [Acidovorax sp. FJL06]
MRAPLLAAQFLYLIAFFLPSEMMVGGVYKLVGDVQTVYHGVQALKMRSTASNGYIQLKK